MSLSIIVPCLNEAPRIAAALETLAPMRRRGVQIIVVDGGSSDDTVTLARGGADLVLTAPRGRSTQMNAGAARASGACLLFLHADSRPPENADILISEGLSESGRGWGRFDVTIEGRHPLLPVIGAFMNARSRLTGIATGDQGLFVTKSLFEQAGGYREIPLMEDVALSTTLKRFCAPLCLGARMTTSGRRWEKHGVLKTVILMWRLRLAFRLGVDPGKLALRYVPHE